MSGIAFELLVTLQKKKKKGRRGMLYCERNYGLRIGEDEATIFTVHALVPPKGASTLCHTVECNIMRFCCAIKVAWHMLQN